MNLAEMTGEHLEQWEHEKDLMQADLITSSQSKLSAQLGVQVSLQDTMHYLSEHWSHAGNEHKPFPTTYLESAREWEEGRRKAMDWLRKKYGLGPSPDSSKQAATPSLFKTVCLRLKALSP